MYEWEGEDVAKTTLVAVRVCVTLKINRARDLRLATFRLTAIGAKRQKRSSYLKTDPSGRYATPMVHTVQDTGLLSRVNVGTFPARITERVSRSTGRGGCGRRA